MIVIRHKLPTITYSTYWPNTSIFNKTISLYCVSSKIALEVISLLYLPLSHIEILPFLLPPISNRYSKYIKSLQIYKAKVSVLIIVLLL